MKEELNQALIKDFPNLYSTDMYFEIGDGWEPIIRELSIKLDPICKLETESAADNFFGSCKAMQVKEKFGGLRFYMTYETEEMSKAIKLAEVKATITCEYCGKPGELRNTSWLKVKCDDCLKGKKDA